MFVKKQSCASDTYANIRIILLNVFSPQGFWNLHTSSNFIETLLQYLKLLNRLQCIRSKKKKKITELTFPLHVILYTVDLY